MYPLQQPARAPCQCAERRLRKGNFKAGGGQGSSFASRVLAASFGDANLSFQPYEPNGRDPLCHAFLSRWLPSYSLVQDGIQTFRANGRFSVEGKLLNGSLLVKPKLFVSDPLHFETELVIGEVFLFLFERPNELRRGRTTGTSRQRSLVLFCFVHTCGWFCSEKIRCQMEISVSPPSTSWFLQQILARKAELPVSIVPCQLTCIAL